MHFLFQGLDVIVHRGIYETAKGMYELMLPEVRDHLKSHGDRATFRFTGHSLGGSLSLLLNLMLLIRGEVPPSSLLPVITFGAPSIMCGGDRLLQELGLPRSHVQAITSIETLCPGLSLAIILIMWQSFLRPSMGTSGTIHVLIIRYCNFMCLRCLNFLAF